MDYKRPKYDLGHVKKLIKKNAFAITRRAAIDAYSQFGFEDGQVKEVFLNLEHMHFYKSMDSDINHKIRQDVYHFPHRQGIIYIKFQLININHLSIMVMSFKKK